MPNRFRFWLTAFMIALGGFLAACQSSHVPEPRAAVPTKKVQKGDILWHFVHDQCVPNHLAGQQPPLPCIHVDPAAGFVIFKDRNGPLQYLHMPTRRVSGLEDPLLLTMSHTPYFAQAWHARTYLDELLGSPIALREYSFTVNSKGARSQNQLHIHMSCIRPAVRDQLHSLLRRQRFDSRWQIVRERFNHHTYYARTLSLEELENRGAIALTLATLPDAQQHLNDLTMVVYPLSDRQFLLLASITSGVSAEWDFQDHRCPQLLNGLRKKAGRTTAVTEKSDTHRRSPWTHEKNL